MLSQCRTNSTLRKGQLPPPHSYTRTYQLKLEIEMFYVE
jgi:hypothetical protein